MRPLQVCVEQLITRGANISAADAQQGTPMHAAGESGRDDLMKLMLEYKLAQVIFCQSPRMHSCNRPNILHACNRAQDEKLLRQIDVGDES